MNELNYSIDYNSNTFTKESDNGKIQKNKVVYDFKDDNIIIFNDVAKNYDEPSISKSFENENIDFVINKKLDKMNDSNEYNQFEDKIKHFIYINENILAGNYYNYEEYFRKLYDEDSKKSILWIRSLLKSNYYSNDRIVIAILHLFSHFEYEEIGDEVWSMISSLFSHKNKKIQKYALKTFDNWNENSTVGILKGTQINIKWLDEYRLNIIERLERLR